MTTQVKKFIIHKLIDGTYASGGGGGVDFSQPVDDNLIIDTDDTEALLIRKDGDLGDVFRIDTVNSRLEYKDGNESIGRVLTSDANGVATWGAAGVVNQASLLDGTITIPSINFLNDTTMGIHRTTIGGEFNFVKSGVPVMTLDDGEVIVNSSVCARSYDIGEVSYTAPSTLGTPLGVYHFLGSTVGDLLTSETGSYTLTNNVNVANDRRVLLLGGRSNVLRVDQFNTGASGGRGFYSDDSTDITAIQGLNDVFISFWHWVESTSAGRLFSVHNGATGLTSATDYIAVKKVGANIVVEIKEGGFITSTSTIHIQGSLQWYHYAIEFSTTNGIISYINNVAGPTFPAVTKSFSSIPITRWVIGGDDEDWSEALSNREVYVDNYAFVAGNLTVQKVDDLFNDAISYTGTASFSQQSRLRYDTNDGKTKLELQPSGDDVWTADATDMEVIKPLKYTGATPTDKHVLTSDASGNATWSSLNLQAYTVGTLPSGTTGDIAYVTDGSAVSYRAVATGSGAVIALVFFDGTNWIYH